MVYSCAFCEFVQDILDDVGENGVFSSDPLFESKYLFHLMSVHGLEK